jgi:hypothetical protein
MQKVRTELTIGQVALAVILWATMGIALIMILVVVLRS